MVGFPSTMTRSRTRPVKLIETVFVDGFSRNFRKSMRSRFVSVPHRVTESGLAVSRLSFGSSSSTQLDGAPDELDALDELDELTAPLDDEALVPPELALDDVDDEAVPASTSWLSAPEHAAVRLAASRATTAYRITGRSE